MPRIARRQPWNAQEFSRPPYLQIIKMSTKTRRIGLSPTIFGSAFHIGRGYFLTVAHNFHRPNNLSKLVRFGRFHYFNPNTKSWQSSGNYYRFEHLDHFVIPSEYFSNVSPTLRRAFDLAIFKLPNEVLFEAPDIFREMIRSFDKKQIKTWKEPTRSTLIGFGDDENSGVRNYTCGFPGVSAQLHFANFAKLLPPNSSEVKNWGISYSADASVGMSGGPLLVDFTSAKTRKMVTYIFGVHNGFIDPHNQNFKFARTITKNVRKFIEQGVFVLEKTSPELQLDMVSNLESAPKWRLSLPLEEDALESAPAAAAPIAKDLEALAPAASAPFSAAADPHLTPGETFDLEGLEDEALDAPEPAKSKKPTG